MSVHNAVNPSKSPGFSGRLLTLLALTVALSAAFVVAPRLLAGRFADERAITDALREAFVQYWNSGDRDLSPGLTSVVDYWFRYHVAKAVIAAVLLVVLVALGVLLWKAFLRAGGSGVGRRAALASSGALVTLFALFALVVLMANIQGVQAPYAALLPMLMDGATGEVAGALDQIRRDLAAPGAGGRVPATEVMIGAFQQFHVVMAVIAAVVAAAVVGLSLASWTKAARGRSADRRTRRVFASFGVVSAVVALGAVVLVVANTTVAADPAPALLALFQGGW